MKAIKALVVDDEEYSRGVVVSLLEQNFPEIEIVDKAKSAIEAIKSINKHNPDIVFLDIEMLDGTGFDVLDALPKVNFQFIFITSYSHYAIKAFKYSATDYITKPVDIDEFTEAVEKLKQNIVLNIHTGKNLEVLQENISAKTPTRIIVPDAQGYNYIKLEEIIRFEADGRYTQLYLNEGRKITISKILREFSYLVDDKYFFRTHKSHIINLNYVKTLLKHEGGEIIMDDNSRIALSRERKKDFVKVMEGIGLE